MGSILGNQYTFNDTRHTAIWYHFDVTSFCSRNKTFWLRECYFGQKMDELPKLKKKEVEKVPSVSRYEIHLNPFCRLCFALRRQWKLNFVRNFATSWLKFGGIYCYEERRTIYSFQFGILKCSFRPLLKKPSCFTKPLINITQPLKEQLTGFTVLNGNIDF